MGSCVSRLKACLTCDDDDDYLEMGPVLGEEGLPSSGELAKVGFLA